MTKIIVLGDTHIGARNASLVVSNHQISLLEKQIIPYCEKHKIKQILQTGDLFDSRKFTNHIILDEWKRRVFNVLRDRNITLHVLLGNHDISTKNTTSINSPSLFLGEYENIKIYDKPAEVMFGKLSTLIVPWICRDNYMECELMLSESKALWCFGHFELDGFEMHRGQTHVGGMTAESLKRFEQVVSGHFHTRSESKNIKYVGTPYEMTWIDYDDPKGFHILDTAKRELEFIKNDLTLFNKLFYNDKDQGPDYFKSFAVDVLANTYVKVIVVSKTDPYQFDRFLDKLYQVGCADLKIVEDMTEFESDNVDDDDLEMEDTLSLIDSYIDSVDIELDKKKMKKLMNTLYVESLEILS